MWPLPDEGFFPHFGGRGSDLDARLARQVRERLRGDGHIRVEVQNGVAVLSGTVASPAGRTGALRAARSVPGVREVCNRVHVVDAGGPVVPGAAETDIDRAFAAIVADILAPQPVRHRRGRPAVTWTLLVLLALAAVSLYAVALSLRGPGWAVACELIAAALAVALAWRPLRRSRNRRRP